MNFTIACPACRLTLRVPESLLGQAVKCPSCGHTFTAPESTEEPAPPPSAAPATVDYNDEDALPRRRSRAGDKPSTVQTIAVLILVGGIVALLYGLSGLAVGIMTCVGMLWPGTYYSIVLGILAIVKGAHLMGENASREGPPRGIGIMMIVNVLNCDFVNLTLGILVLVFLKDEEVTNYFRV